MQIPLADTKRWFLHRKDEISAAINDVIASGNYILGEQVSAFEKEFANWNGSKFAVGVGNGTDAIRLALMAVDIGGGDEVITSAHTSVATISAIVQNGAAPVLIDIDENSRCLNPQLMASAITYKTKAIIPVHMFGHPVDMDAILKIGSYYNLHIVEDCAQAHGAEFQNKNVGKLGHFGAFSFYPTKNIGAAGDAGMVVTDDENLAKKLYALREYGAMSKRLISDFHGINSRLDELQAAILRVRLKYFEGDQIRRNAIAKKYLEELGQNDHIRLPALPEKGQHAMHLFVIETKCRDSLRQYLADAGIQTGLHYPEPIHHLPGYKGLIRIAGDLEQTEELYRNMLTIPLFPELTDEEVYYVCKKIKEWKVIKL
jgi:dTDP-4-amino-4,6-dideoxygalactose transaminase